MIRVPSDPPETDGSAEPPDLDLAAAPALTDLAAIARALRLQVEIDAASGWLPPLETPPRLEASPRPPPKPDWLGQAPGSGTRSEHADRERPVSSPGQPAKSAGSGSKVEVERTRRETVFEPLRFAASACTACALHSGRRQAVFGVGDPMARLMFVGEAPGADEDRVGEPFVGAAGQLLDRMIRAMGFEREDVYIANVCKCRPPGNRTPLASEMSSCLPFLRQQIETIRPEVICALGGVASKALLDTTDGVGRLRGRFHDFAGIPLRVTYHPAYLLREPSGKAKAWIDLQAIMARLGVSP